MASMISYFGRVKRGEKEELPFLWNGATDLAENLNALPAERQLRILFDQSLAAAYYLKFYGPRCHEVINDFIEELNADICFRFSRRFSQQLQGNFQKIHTMLTNLVKFNRGGNWSDVDIRLVDEFMFDGTSREGEPRAFCKCKRSVLIPFLIWMNKSVQEGYTDVAFEKTGVASFHLDEGQQYESDHMRMSIAIEPHFIGQSFSAERVPLDQLKSCPLLAFLSHFNWNGKSFETCVGVVSNFCLHTDIERYGLSMDHHLAYCLRTGVIFPRFNIAGDHDGVNPTISKYHSELFNALLAFVKFCTEHRAMIAVDRTIVAKAFGCFAYTKEQKESVAYLNKQEATASADELKSFKQVMGSVESLQLISQNPTLVTAQTETQVTGSTEDAKTGDGEGNGNTDTGSDKKNDQSPEKKDDPDKKEEGKEDDDSKPSDDEDGSDDFMDDTSDGSTEFDASDVSGEGQSDGSSDSSFGDGNSPSTQNTGTPDEINTSDDEGIDFVITPPEMATVDSVLFREEMYKFLTNVLTNPPKCLTPQDIATLTALKRFWLSCLSIETIKGIVEACIRLPLSIKHSIHKSTELKK